jgi:rhomboid-like protein
VPVATLTALPSRFESLGALGPIVVLNGSVYAAWWLAPSRFMFRHFTHAPLRGPHWTLLLAAFSHRSLMHLGLNMWALHSFGAPLQERWGEHRFAAAYISACAVSSAGVSVLAALAPAALAAPGLGASGGVMALVVAACLLEPHSRVSIPFAPQLSLPAGDAVKLIIGADTVGLCATLLGIPSPLGHAAHLGGQAFGCWLLLGGGLSQLDRALHHARGAWRDHAGKAGRT